MDSLLKKMLTRRQILPERDSSSAYSTKRAKPQKPEAASHCLNTGGER